MADKRFFVVAFIFFIKKTKNKTKKRMVDRDSGKFYLGLDIGERKVSVHAHVCVCVLGIFLTISYHHFVLSSLFLVLLPLAEL